MKLRKRKLFSSIAFALSVIMLAVSGAVFVHTATQQSATSSLSVTFSGENVNYEVQGWYQVHGGNRAELVDNDQDNDNIVTFSATEPPTEKTLKISNTEVNNKAVLTSEHPYVLFTYKFTNTASEGAFGMEVSLNMTSITNSNLKAVKYGTDTSLYTEANLESTISSKVTNTASSTTIFDDDFIVAGKTGPSDTSSIKYYYILLEINDLTLPVTFNPSFDWDVECSDNVEAPLNLVTVTVSGPGLQDDTYKVYYVRTETEPNGGPNILNYDLSGWILIDGPGTISVEYGNCLTISGYAGALPTSSNALNPFSVEISAKRSFWMCNFYMNYTGSEPSIEALLEDGTTGHAFSNITEDFSLYFDSWYNAM